MHLTSFDEFKDLAQRGTFVPVYKEIVADMLTPVSAFLKIAENSDYARAAGRRSSIGQARGRNRTSRSLRRCAS